MYNIFLCYQVVSGFRGSNKGGGWGHMCISGYTENRQVVHRTKFGLCRVMEKPPGEIIIKNVKVSFFLKRDRLL